MRRRPGAFVPALMQRIQRKNSFGSLANEGTSDYNRLIIYLFRNKHEAKANRTERAESRYIEGIISQLPQAYLPVCPALIRGRLEAAS